MRAFLSMIHTFMIAIVTVIVSSPQYFINLVDRQSTRRKDPSEEEEKDESTQQQQQQQLEMAFAATNRSRTSALVASSSCSTTQQNRKYLSETEELETTTHSKSVRIATDEQFEIRPARPITSLSARAIVDNRPPSILKDRSRERDAAIDVNEAALLREKKGCFIVCGYDIKGLCFTLFLTAILVAIIVPVTLLTGTFPSAAPSSSPTAIMSEEMMDDDIVAGRYPTSVPSSSSSSSVIIPKTPTVSPYETSTPTTMTPTQQPPSFVITNTPTTTVSAPPSTSSPTPKPTASPTILTLDPTNKPTSHPTSSSPTTTPSSNPTTTLPPTISSPPTISLPPTISTAPTTTPTPPLTLLPNGDAVTAPLPNPKSQFGYYVSLSRNGSRISVGAPLYDSPSGGERSGFAGVYSLSENATIWTPMGSNSPLYGTAPNEWFGWNAPLSSSDESNVLAVSGGLSSNLPTDHYVRVYRLNEDDGNEWIPRGIDLTGPYGFGSSISLSSTGDRVAIGAKKAVRVYDYDYDKGEWIVVGGMTAVEEERYAIVALAGGGGRLAVGAAFDGEMYEDGGRVRVFDYDDGGGGGGGGDEWVLVGGAIYGNGPGDQFGSAVSMNDDGSVVAVGCSGGNYVKVLRQEEGGGEWIPYGNDISGNDMDRTMFGFKVEISGNAKRLIVGSPLYDLHHGRSVIYRYNSAGVWTPLLEVTGLEIDDQEGYDVAFSADGGTIASSALNGNDYQGRIRVFKLQ